MVHPEFVVDRANLQEAQFHAFGGTGEVLVGDFTTHCTQPACPAMVLSAPVFIVLGTRLDRSVCGQQFGPMVRKGIGLGRDCLNRQAFRRQERPGDGVLVVYLVGGVGINDEPHAATGRLQADFQQGWIQDWEGHDGPRGRRRGPSEIPCQRHFRISIFPAPPSDTHPTRRYS